MSSPQGLAESILPVRGAAKRATASFAGQLADSPGRSDAESPSPSNPFHEPTHRTRSVKYRYSATGKHLSSPLKGSSSSPERKPGKSTQARQASFTLARPSHAAKAKAPPVATTSRKRKAPASFFREEDALNSVFSSCSSPLSSAPSTPIEAPKNVQSSHALACKQPIPDPPKRRLISKSISLRSLGPAPSQFSVFSQPLSPKRKQKKNKNNAEKDVGVWDIGSSVWVLVNQSGLLANNENDLKLSELFMWWPAQVVQKHPLRVSMFGDFPSSSSASRGLCTIFAPSSFNVQSINNDSGAKRFSRTTFCLTSLSAKGDVSPPTKKPRLDESASLEAKWESAVECMEKASTLEKDGLPALLSSFATTGAGFDDSLDDSDPDVSGLRRSLPKPPSATSKKSRPVGSTRKLKPQRSRATLRDDANGNTSPGWSLCFPDPTLQIPGELVLALAPRTGGAYWPAQIVEHVPGRKEKYRIKFLDDEIHVIARDKFWTSEEEGFVRCTLGEWESAVKITDDPESGDEGGGYDADDDVNTEDPASALLPPPPPEDFEDLSVRVQLAYAKPVLRAILKKEYAPTRAKHDAFMMGGSGRAALLKSAGVRGGMDARFVNAVQKAICKWVLGDSGLKPKKLDTGDTANRTSVAEGADGPEGGTTVEVVYPEVAPRGSMEDNKMVGIDGATVPTDSHAGEGDGGRNGASSSLATDRQVEVVQDPNMAVDEHEQHPVPLSPTANGASLSPAIKQASLAPKSQLDLLAEVSQAVATEPSLLPSHPELSRLKVDLLDIPCKDTSPQPSPLTPVSEGDQRISSGRSAPVVCEEFETLSGVEKLDYCLNILLPECIQQLLLWRSGERTSSGLLPPEEEKRLHDMGVRKAAETDWVDDVMRLRAAQARLWGIDSGKQEEKKSEVDQGGTRSRPRRETVARP